MVGCWRKCRTPECQQAPCDSLDWKSCSHHSSHLGWHFISPRGSKQEVDPVIKFGSHFTDSAAFLGRQGCSIIGKDTLLGIPGVSNRLVIVFVSMDET